MTFYFLFPYHQNQNLVKDDHAKSCFEIRCKLEQSAAVWNSSLTLRNSNNLEKVQKAAVRIIKGRAYESYCYTETLKELGIMRLSKRRDIICLKFAKNSMKLSNLSKFFLNIVTCMR